MPVPATIDDLSTTAGSNSPSGSETPKDGDNYIRSLSSFIASLRDKLNGTAATGTVKDATFTGTHTFSAGNLLSGLYTPTLADVSNSTNRTAYECQYLRVGDTVTVSGQFIAAAVSAPGVVIVSMTLPITSSFTQFRHAGGSGMQVSSTTYDAMGIYANPGSSVVHCLCTASGAGSLAYSFQFTYRVI